MEMAKGLKKKGLLKLNLFYFLTYAESSIAVYYAI